MKHAAALALLLAPVLNAAPVHAAKVAAPPVFTLRVGENGNPYLPVAVKRATLNIRIALSFDSTVSSAVRANAILITVASWSTFTMLVIPASLMEAAEGAATEPSDAIDHNGAERSMVRLNVSQMCLETRRRSAAI